MLRQDNSWSAALIPYLPQNGGHHGGGTKFADLLGACAHKSREVAAITIIKMLFFMVFSSFE
jgi:hypothetical protein